MITFKHVYLEEENMQEQIEEKVEEQIEEQVQDANSPKAKAAEFFSRTRAAATAMHIFHLMTPSYAAHVAAQGFYEGVVPLIDAFAETFIGRYGKFETFPNVKEAAIDGLQIVGNLTKWIDTNRAMISEYSEIQNEIDNIVNLCNSTAYKLRELK